MSQSGAGVEFRGALLAGMRMSCSKWEKLVCAFAWHDVNDIFKRQT